MKKIGKAFAVAALVSFSLMSCETTGTVSETDGKAEETKKVKTAFDEGAYNAALKKQNYAKCVDSLEAKYEKKSDDVLLYLDAGSLFALEAIKWHEIEDNIIGCYSNNPEAGKIKNLKSAAKNLGDKADECKEQLRKLYDAKITDKKDIKKANEQAVAAAKAEIASVTEKYEAAKKAYADAESTYRFELAKGAVQAASNIKDVKAAFKKPDLNSAKDAANAKNAVDKAVNQTNEAAAFITAAKEESDKAKKAMEAAEKKYNSLSTVSGLISEIDKAVAAENAVKAAEENALAYASELTGIAVGSKKKDSDEVYTNSEIIAEAAKVCEENYSKLEEKSVHYTSSAVNFDSAYKAMNARAAKMSGSEKLKAALVGESSVEYFGPMYEYYLTISMSALDYLKAGKIENSNAMMRRAINEYKTVLNQAKNGEAEFNKMSEQLLAGEELKKAVELMNKAGVYLPFAEMAGATPAKCEDTYVMSPLLLYLGYSLSVKKDVVTAKAYLDLIIAQAASKYFAGKKIEALISDKDLGEFEVFWGKYCKETAAETLKKLHKEMKSTTAVEEFVKPENLAKNNEAEVFYLKKLYTESFDEFISAYLAGFKTKVNPENKEGPRINKTYKEMFSDQIVKVYGYDFVSDRAFSFEDTFELFGIDVADAKAQNQAENKDGRLEVVSLIGQIGKKAEAKKNFCAGKISGIDLAFKPAYPVHADSESVIKKVVVEAGGKKAVAALVEDFDMAAAIHTKSLARGAYERSMFRAITKSAAVIPAGVAAIKASEISLKEAKDQQVLAEVKNPALGKVAEKAVKVAEEKIAKAQEKLRSGVNGIVDSEKADIRQCNYVPANSRVAGFILPEGKYNVTIRYYDAFDNEIGKETINEVDVKAKDLSMVTSSCAQ